MGKYWKGEWPAGLVKELADRRALLVVGAGLSATATDSSLNNPPTWGSLISDLCDAAVPVADRPLVKNLITAKKFPEAAEEVMARSDRQSLNLAFQKILVDPKFTASQAHKDLMTIDQPIIVNLNYDRIFENHCIGLDSASYVVTHYYQNDFVRSIRSPRRVILKLHGSTDDSDQVIFSLSDYNKIKKDNTENFKVLEALLLTKTVLFIGCGFNGDPDVEGLLTEAALSNAAVYPHYALVSDQGDELAFARAKREGMNLKFLSFDVGEDPTVKGKKDYSGFSEAIADLKNCVLEERRLSL